MMYTNMKICEDRHEHAAIPFSKLSIGDWFIQGGNHLCTKVNLTSYLFWQPGHAMTLLENTGDFKVVPVDVDVTWRFQE